VLRQVRQLSGTELVLRDEAGRLIASSSDDFESAPTGGIPEVVTIGESTYFFQRVNLDRRAGGGDRYQLELFYPERTYREARWQAIFPTLMVGGAALVLAVALASMAAARVTEPVQLLKRQTERIAAGDFNPVHPPPRDDELRDLAQAVNRMAEMLQANAAQLRQHERTQTLHQIGAGIAHQLRNAATGCRIALDLFRRQHAASADENLLVAARQLELMESYLQRFLILGRTAQREFAPVDLREVITNSLALVRPLAEHLRVAIDIDLGAQPITVCADRTNLEQVFVNLLTNAIEACAVPEVAQPRVQVQLTVDSAKANLEVRDNGLGFSPQIAPRLGEPFATTKPEGTGLGIAVAREILSSHQGELTWHRVDDWTTFAVILPTVGEV
jgi:nitrogen fixation/metabolism regulation signal transduction histidine kinase